MNLKIYIRADGNPRIGMGHLIRCLALAQMLYKDFEITFICREIPDAFIHELHSIGLNYNKIENETEFFRLLNRNCITVLDGYKFDSSYQKQVKTSMSRLVCIDEMNDKEYFADLIINQSPGMKPSDYKAQQYTKFALGLEYVLLRPAFLEQAKKSRVINKIETGLICFGGSDFKNLTQRVLEVTCCYAEFKKIIVVTGPAYQIPEDLIKLISSDYRIDHRHALSEMQMMTSMVEAELAIVPASGILFEALASGCFIISGYYIENQKSIYDSLLDRKAILGANNFESLNSRIEESFLINSASREKVIDGESDVRLLKIFNELC